MELNKRKGESYASKIRNKVLLKEVTILRNRMIVSNRAESSRRSYIRALVKLAKHHQKNPREMDLDEVIDFLTYLQTEQSLNWRTIKLYVAGLRYYYKEIVDDTGISKHIPYPKEKPSLPKLLSRSELDQLFDGCLNFKHKVMFRLMYSSGLRRNELAQLKINDIDTQDGKMRIRINNGKGGKDRYTVLSETILNELRTYFIQCRPKEYLFNGMEKGKPMSLGGIRHALLSAIKRSGIKKPVNMHILRHCFASHALEDGLNIKTLQYLLGHSTINTTLIYLHISEIPLSKAFSPLDNWD